MNDPDLARDTPVAVHRSPSAHDPWVIGGLVLLAVLTWAASGLYRSGPQSAGSIRDRVWLAARPDAFTPRIAEAERLMQQAEAARGRGNLEGALSALASAAIEAEQARGAAAETEQVALANGIWGEAMLRRVTLIVELGSAPWWRGDDDALLTEALHLVDQVLAAAPPPALRTRAEALRADINRKLRPGPLEWLPSPR